ncbi:MAG: amidophosphoribosyltransferase, partial [Oscillospiraceae bacterium]|nr:amidophosphoribosyltransferase [Oscillospiraceae bacterium]
IPCHKDTGSVRNIFSNDELSRLPEGNVAIGHTRYSTNKGIGKDNTGPFVKGYLKGRIATSHNGNITNADELRQDLRSHGLVFDSTCDSEVISALIAFCIQNQPNTASGVTDTVAGVIEAANMLQGAFSLVIATGKNKLIAVRDPNGFRPLCIGESKIGYAVASESCALDACGFKFMRDIKPGEVIVIDNGKMICCELDNKQKRDDRGICIFEYVYFARPDSVIEGLSVHDARYNMGAILAKEHPIEADAVCGVPDSGLEAAQGYSACSGIPLVSGFVLNRYLGRSFINPTQSQRDRVVSLKLNPLEVTVRGKRIILIDDSIVRGTTCKSVIASLRKAGAKEVHMMSSSPPFKHICRYGTDINDEKTLIANKMSMDDIHREIGANSLGFISLNGLTSACGQCSMPFCTACFTGV